MKVANELNMQIMHIWCMKHV